MEYAEGGDLSTYLTQQKHLREDLARKIFHQLIDSLYYLHQIGICHRNLKLENILFFSKKRDTIKIINFGHSNLYLTGVNSDNPTLAFGAEFLETPFGSGEYTPPEMILGCKYDGLLLDIWSCGIILYLMLFGCFPFEDNNIDKLYTKIIKGEFNYPKSINISEEAKLLITKLLVVNPRLRSSIIDVKRDVWFMKDYEQVQGLYISIREIPISDLIIQKMEKFGFNKNEIIKEIKNNRHNSITTIYYLLVNKFRKEGIGNISDLISNDFKDYLKEQDLKNNLIKKGEKPISLKIMKSDSKPLFDLDNSFLNGQNKKFDLNYLKSIFQAYEQEENLELETKINVNQKKNNKINKKKDNQKSMNMKNNDSTKEKRAKSQNTKNINKKNKNINKDRYSYSTSLNKRNHKKIKGDNKIKIASQTQNIISEKEERKNNSKIKQIMNIKEIIKTKNKRILNSNFKETNLTTSKKNPIRNHLVINSISFSRNIKNSEFVNNNIFTINNNSKIKLNKIRETKEKNIKNINIKNLSLKNKYNNESIFNHLIISKNNLDKERNKENNTMRNNKHNYKLNSASSSKSKSIKSKSNYSIGKGETIFCQKDSLTKKKKKTVNKKISVIKPGLFNEENNFSHENILNTINGRKKAESISTSEPKKIHKKNGGIQNKSKSPNKSNKKMKYNNKRLKSGIIQGNNNYSSRKFNNNKIIINNSRNKNRNNNDKERKTSNNINQSNNAKTNSKKENVFKNVLSGDINFDLSKNKNKTKLFLNISKKLNKNPKEISPAKKQVSDKKYLNNFVNKEIYHGKKDNEEKNSNKNQQMIKKTYTNLNLQNKKQKINRITNIRSISLKNEKEKKDENPNKNKMKQIKSIKMANISNGDIEIKTAKHSEKKAYFL